MLTRDGCATAQRPWLLRRLRSDKFALSRRACFEAAKADFRIVGTRSLANDRAPFFDSERTVSAKHSGVTIQGFTMHTLVGSSGSL